MAVLDPVRVVLANYPEGKTERIKVPNMPLDPNTAHHEVPFSRVVYIDRSDFQPALVKGYKRLAPGQPVGLKQAGYVISVKDIHKDASGNVVELIVDAEPVTEQNKPQAFIHWVSSEAGQAPATAEVRVYNQLFLFPNPDEAPGGFLKGLNPNSLACHENALIDSFAAAAAVPDTFQFERVGYFCVDTDSKPGKLVFNCTVSLKEDSSKKKLEA